MSKPIDSMLNSLIDEHLQDWGHYLARRLGLPIGPVKALDTDLSKNLQADRLFLIEVENPYCIHLEMESTGRLKIPQELLRYNVIAQEVAQCDIYTVIMLLRPKANASDLTGRFERGQIDHVGYLRFDYGVVRVWEEPFNRFVGSIGLSPLSLLTDEAFKQDSRYFQQLVDKLKGSSLPNSLTASLLNSTFVLSGLRYSEERLAKLFEDLVVTLEDSTSYQAILRKGLERGLREGSREGKIEGSILTLKQNILRLATKRLGSPSAENAAVLDSISDLDRLNQMLDAILDVENWDQLFQNR